MISSLILSSDEEGGLSITAERRSHPDSGATSSGSMAHRPRQPPRRPQLWKREPAEREMSEDSEGSEEEEEEQLKDKEYEDEDYGEFLAESRDR